MYQCGFYEMEITPPLGCSMPGYFHRRPCRDFFDQLYVKAWVIRNEKTTLAIAAVDHIGLMYSSVSFIKQRTAQLSGILPEHILIGCSHIHTGGPMTQDDNTPQDKEYLNFLETRVADTIVMAAKRLKPSELYLGSGGLEGYSFCRIYHIEGGLLKTNPSSSYSTNEIKGPYRKIGKTVEVVEIKQDGKTAGILVNFMNHCDVVGSETSISADFPGELRRCLKDRYGPDVTVLYLQGGCGNINHMDPFNYEATTKPDRYIEIGKALADEVINIMKCLELCKSYDLAGITEEITLHLQKPDEKLLSWAEKILAKTPEDLYKLSQWKKDQVDLYFAKQALGAHTNGKTERITTLQVLNIGDLGIYASPGELFSEFAEELISKSPFKRTFVSAYSNDYIGYIVAPELCRVDGVYEGRQTKERTFTPQTGGIMNEGLLRLGKALYQRSRL